jgi:hypothetical protein
LCPWNARRELYQKVSNFVGSVSSPVLANIYLHELDCFVESLITSFERGKVRKETTEYRLLQNQTKRLTKKIDQEKDATQRLILLNEKKALQRHKMEIPSVDQHDPDFRRLSYCRYADDFVLGATCPKSEAEAIYRKIEVFLN